MKSLRLLGLVMLLAIATDGVAPAYGQQPSPGAPLGSKWCPNVPETPPPPHGKPEDWANIFKYCSNLNPAYREKWISCQHMCEAAQGAWRTYKNPPPKTVYQSTTEPQEPIHHPGGTTEYIVPLLPNSVASPSPAAGATPGAPQGSADPGADGGGPREFSHNLQAWRLRLML